MQKITTFLWFDNNAEEAASFYVSVFKNAEIRQITRYGDGAPLPKGTPLTISFSLEEQEFVALNGSEQMSFNTAVSFVVNCETQEEIDSYWEKLSEGGKEEACGWLKDRFGLSWQIVPTLLGSLLNNPDPQKAQNAMTALLGMKKIDMNALVSA